MTLVFAMPYDAIVAFAQSMVTSLIARDFLKTGLLRHTPY